MFIFSGPKKPKKMSKYMLMCLSLLYSISSTAQSTLTINNYALSAPNAYDNLDNPTPVNGVVTIAVNDPNQDAYLSTLILEGDGTYINAGDDLIIDGNGISQIVFNYDVVESSSGRTISIKNCGKVHFNSGVFTSTGSNGPITLIIGDDNVSSSSGVTTLEFDKEPVLNGGVYEISVGTIINNVSDLTFPAIDHDTYSKVKFSSWSSSSTQTPIFQTFVSNDGDRMICSPTTNGFTSASAANSGTSVTMTTSNLYVYDATDGDWDSNPTTTSAGTGFFGFVGSGTNTTGVFLASSPALISFEGTPNASHTHNLGYASNAATGGSGDGWNLIGNPYPATIDWSTVSLTNVNNAIYIWDPNTELYRYYVSGTAPSGTYIGSSISAFIPPMQSFWVQATASGASIATTSELNTTIKSTPTTYKTMPDNLIVSLVNVTDTMMQDVFWIKNVASTSLEFEGVEDAWKYKNPNMPSIYTTDSLGEGIAINSIDLSTQHFVPFNIETQLGGDYTLSLEEIVVNPNAYQVYLLDLELNTSHDLSSGSATLTLDSTTLYEDRFALFATTNSTVGLEDLNPSLPWSTKVTGEGIEVVVDHKEVRYELIDLNGRILSSGTFDTKEFIPVQTAGIKVLRVWCAEGSAVRKFNVIK